MKILKSIFNPVVILVLLAMTAYYPFFLQGKVPFPGDVLTGAYFPWLDYKWGYVVGVPVKNALISDAFSQFIVWKYVGLDLLLKGEWPLWNHLSFAGSPLLATYQTAQLLPFNLLLLLPVSLGWSLYIFGQTLMALLGMFYLLKTYKLENYAAVGGAIIFSFSGLMTTWVEFMTGVYAVAMIPFILASIEQFLQNGKMRHLFILTLAFATLYLSGFAQMTIYSTILFFGYLAFKFFIEKEFSKKKLLFILFFWVSAVLICSIQFIPTYTHLQNSVRGVEEYSKTINYGLNKPYEIVRFFAADFFGNPTTNNHWDTIYYHEQSSFLGSLTLPLLLPFLFRRFRTKLIAFWLVVFGLSIFLAIETFATRFIYSQPLPLLTYSSASRIFFITSLSAGVLSGFGLHKLKEEQFRYYIGRFAGVILAVITGIIVGIITIKFMTNGYKDDTEVILLLKNLMVSIKNLVLPVGLLVTLFILTKFKNKVVIYLLIGLMFFDLSRYFLKHNPFVPSHLLFPKTDVTDFLQQQQQPFRIARTDLEAFPPNTWTAYGLESIEGYDPLALESYGRYFNKVNDRGFNSGIDRFMELNYYPSNFLDALNVKYLIAVKRDEKGVIPGELLNYRLKDTDYQKIYEYKTVAVLENPHALGRVYRLDSLANVTSVRELGEQMDQKSFDPRKKGLVLTSDDLPASPSAVEIKNLVVSPQKTDFVAQSDQDSFIVVANSFDEGWKLKVDGVKQKIYQVNSALQGVKIEKGEHKYELFYYPAAFDYGLKLTIVGLALFFGMLGYVVFKKRF